jgi:hypothetical protein
MEFSSISTRVIFGLAVSLGITSYLASPAPAQRTETVTLNEHGQADQHLDSNRAGTVVENVANSLLIDHSDQTASTNAIDSRTESIFTHQLTPAYQPPLQRLRTYPWIAVPPLRLAAAWDQLPEQRSLQNRSAKKQNDDTTQRAVHLADEMPATHSEIQPATALEQQMKSDQEQKRQLTPFDERALLLFQQASEGEFPEGETGDGILDDMLHMMKHTGSISSKLAASRGFEELDSALVQPVPETEPTSEKTHRTKQKSLMDKKARSAEQLLKAARFLEKTQEDSANHVRLIQEMRSTAGDLLSN